MECFLDTRVKNAYADAMKNRLFSLFLSLLVCVSLFAETPVARAAQSDAEDALRFGADGTFTVLALSDLQDTQHPTPQLLGAVTQTLQQNDVDLIVLLGDQLEGNNPLLSLGGAHAVQTAIERLMAPVRDSGIPFAAVFGNHDYDAPFPIQQQARLYDAYETCRGVSFGEGLDKNGAFTLSVLAHSGQEIAMQLYFFDSGSYLASGDYDTVSAEQVAWYSKKSASLRAQNDNQPVPAIAFMHIPLPEVYELFTETERGVAGAFKGVGVGKGRYYLPDPARIFTGEALEAPCPSSRNNGLFDAFGQNDDVFLVLSGHDHVNSFIGNLRGVDIASVPGSTFTGYGSDDARGVRLFRFSEHNVKDYETTVIRFADYNAPSRYGFVRYYLTTTTLIPNLAKLVILAALFIAVIVVLFALATRSKKRRLSAPQTQDDEPEFDDEAE